MPRTESQRRYDKEHLKSITILVNKKTEADLLAYLQDMPKRATYIKQLIRDDMRRRGIDPLSEPAD